MDVGIEVSTCLMIVFVPGKIKYHPVKTDLYLQFTTGSDGGGVVPTNTREEVHMNYDHRVFN